ncbi:hypothetical protein BJY01DRAFT_229013 [Aspergillus pseudoustus]|uniref:Uncharacterized protein n=1 Tax=Aspergillus pseudoustus TaxID=1810923 RepID=A0ABR4IIQ2_9EURO
MPAGIAVAGRGRSRGIRRRRGRLHLLDQPELRHDTNRRPRAYQRVCRRLRLRGEPHLLLSHQSGGSTGQLAFWHL